MSQAGQLDSQGTTLVSNLPDCYAYGVGSGPKSGGGIRCLVLAS